MSSATDHKRAAIEQWTADPCESGASDAEPGTRPYFEDLLRVRHATHAWIADALGYAQTSGLDVLDVGCGQGIDVANYALAGARVTGVDLTPRHLELARAHAAALGLEARIVEGDAERLPFADGSFDRASSNGVLHHTPDMSAALREIRRVLRPGGRLTVIVYNRRSFHYWINQVLYMGVLHGQLLRERSMAGVLSHNVERSSIGARPLVKVYTQREMRDHLRDAGFEGVETEVAHFDPGDTFVTNVLAPRLAFLRDRRVLDAIGRAGGWYVIARGSAPGR
jgi:ubiquinone/menaquinone biosynthesis C-methylase UbiE